MAAPQIAPIQDLLGHAGIRLPAIPLEAFSAESRIFVVIRGGDFSGRRFRAGDVLLCGGTPRPGGSVVLEARGLGRPRLGTTSGVALFGDAGEPCSPVRWKPAGALLAVLRAAEAAPGEARDRLVEGEIRAEAPGYRFVSLRWDAAKVLFGSDEPEGSPRGGDGSGRSPGGGDRTSSGGHPTRQLALFRAAA